MKNVLPINVLESVQMALTGQSTLEDINTLMGSISITSDNELLGKALHQAFHFLDDQDIRERDKEYDALCRQNLSDYVNRIREKYDL